MTQFKKSNLLKCQIHMASDFVCEYSLYHWYSNYNFLARWSVGQATKDIYLSLKLSWFLFWFSTYLFNSLFPLVLRIILVPFSEDMWMSQVFSLLSKMPLQRLGSTRKGEEIPGRLVTKTPIKLHYPKNCRFSQFIYVIKAFFFYTRMSTITYKIN